MHCHIVCNVSRVVAEKSVFLKESPVMNWYYFSISDNVLLFQLLWNCSGARCVIIMS